MADEERADESRRLDLGPSATEVAKNVQRYRTERGWSAAFFAAQMTSSGLPMTRMAITRIESGSRRVTIDELVGLAVALEVSPLALLLPRTESGDESVHISGELFGLHNDPDPYTAREVWEWALGRGALMSAGSKDPVLIENFLNLNRLRSFPLWLEK